MKFAYYILLITTIYFESHSQVYNVNPAKFSTKSYNEFSPVFYKNGLVICSDLKNNSLINYNNEGDNLLNIFFIENKDSITWKNPVLFASELNTNYNEGPVSFSNDSIIYYCRNNGVTKIFADFSDTLNKLGIYSAKYKNGKWTDIFPLNFNNPLYSFITPAVTKDGKILFFASDMPGGLGGMDLYYSEKNNDKWGTPINLGEPVNTAGNESFPFLTESGKVFFASDGHNGYGGKDIFYTQQVKGKWVTPVHLESEINSPFDDFGILTNDNIEEGYFSSNRLRSDDIFTFTSKKIEFENCYEVKKNRYCFLFFDEFQKMNDSIPVEYTWYFSDETKKTGAEAEYCFPGPGIYNIKLVIRDTIADTVVIQTSYHHEIKNIEQVFINSVDEAIVGEEITFDGLKTNLSDFKVSEYLWNFKGEFNIRGPEIKTAFKEKGEYKVYLGLLGEKDSLLAYKKTCAVKTIKVFEDHEEMAMKSAKILFKDDILAEKENDCPVIIFLTDNLAGEQKIKLKEQLFYINSIFEFNSTEISDSSHQFLNNTIKILEEDPNLKLEVAVHGSEKTDKIADNIRMYFIKKGIGENKIHTDGYGSSRPWVYKDVDESKLRRRVEFIFLPDN